MKTRIMTMGFAVVLLLTASVTNVFANTNVKQDGIGSSNSAITDEMVWADSGDSGNISNKNIPDGYREFVRKGSNLYHSLTIYTNYAVEVGKIVKRNEMPVNSDPFEAYYISVGDNTLRLATPDGEILTAEELDEYFLGILPPKTAYEPMEWENEMLRLVNIERKKVGVAPLEANTQLMEIASLKAKEMLELNYASHTSPRYGSPSQFAQHYGYGKTVGENIRGGFVKDISPQGVLDAWLNSEGHRKNLLDPKFKYIGIGWSSKQITNEDGSNSSATYRFVQLFSK